MTANDQTHLTRVLSTSLSLSLFVCPLYTLEKVSLNQKRLKAEPYSQMTSIAWSSSVETCLKLNAYTRTKAIIFSSSNHNNNPDEKDISRTKDSFQFQKIKNEEIAFCFALYLDYNIKRERERRHVISFFFALIKNEVDLEQSPNKPLICHAKLN